MGKNIISKVDYAELKSSVPTRQIFSIAIPFQKSQGA
jgi:hypothetical protein